MCIESAPVEAAKGPAQFGSYYTKPGDDCPRMMSQKSKFTFKSLIQMEQINRKITNFRCSGKTIHTL